MTARRRRLIGCCTAWTKLGSVIVFRSEDHAGLLEAWKRGAAFFDGRDFHCEPLTVKLGDVVCVRLLSPDSMAATREEDRLDAAEDRADELLTGA